MKKLVSFIMISLACLSCSSQKKITFGVSGLPQNTNPKHIGIRGDTSPLSWEKTIYLIPNKDEDGFQAGLEFAKDFNKIEYKYVIDDGIKIVWEGIGNRSEKLSKEHERFKSKWNTDKIIDPSSLPKLTVTQLQNDYEVIKNAIIKVHPGLYRYNDSLSVQKNFLALKESLQKPLTHGEAFLRISKFISTIQCDHTSASYFNQESKINSILHEQENKIPFTFLWIDKRMIIKRNASQSEKLTLGSEVLKINTIPVSIILDTILAYISADGDTLHNKVRKAEVDGLNFRYSSFDVLFPLLFPTKNSTLDLIVKSPEESEAQKVQVTTLSRKKRKNILSSKYHDFEGNVEDLWSFEILKNNIGYLKIGSFGTNMFKKDWKKMLADAFSLFEEKNVDDLILDIRENQGGRDDATYELEKYLYKNTCTNEGFQSQSRFLTFPEDVKEDISTWDTWFYNLKEEEYYQKGRYYVLPRDQALRNLGPTPNTFKGNVVALISGKNVSGAFYLARLLKECNAATLIGQETGGNLNGINGGSILFLKPPNSRINVNLPVVGSFSKGEMPNSGIIPDIVVNKKVDDISNGVDTELKKALEIIGRN